MSNQELTNQSLDRALLDYNEESSMMVPIDVKESTIPEDSKEDFNTIRKNLYNLNDVCVAALNYLVDNMDIIQNSPGIMKQQPTELITDMVKTALSVNDKLIKLNTPSTSNLPKNMTQYNTTIEANKEEKLESVDLMKAMDKQLKEIKEAAKKIAKSEK